jgi:hypothetical protein
MEIKVEKKSLSFDEIDELREKENLGLIIISGKDDSDKSKWKCQICPAN